MSGELVVHAICKKLNADSIMLCEELISTVKKALDIEAAALDEEMTHK